MLFLLLACVTPPSPVTPSNPQQAPVSTLPPPFSAAQIRAAMPLGTKLLFTLDTPQGTRHTRWDVDEHTLETVGFTFVEADSTGKGDVGQSKTFSWTELEGHAHFPAGTTRERDVFMVQNRPLEGWRYRVVGPEGPTVFEFADVLPGPPVRSPGMTLIADSRL